MTSAQVAGRKPTATEAECGRPAEGPRTQGALHGLIEEYYSLKYIGIYNMI